MLLACSVHGGAVAQTEAGSVGFLDEHLRVPESSWLDPEDFVDSGAGLRFGVDKRLSYDVGNYAEAVERFEQLVVSYPYKAEFWVYLARAYFHTKAPRRARQVLERAGAAMPDLRQSFWEPLRASMLDEVRRRANAARAELEFYPRGPADYLAVFRLYTFLEDYGAAGQIIAQAVRNGRRMETLAAAASAASQARYRADAASWSALAAGLRQELVAAGQQGAAGAAGPDTSLNLETLADIRRLQERVDYYAAAAGDFRRLFELYLEAGQTAAAGVVLEALGRDIQRAALQLELTPSGAQAEPHRLRQQELTELRDELAPQLPAAVGEAAP